MLHLTSTAGAVAGHVCPTRLQRLLPRSIEDRGERPDRTGLLASPRRALITAKQASAVRARFWPSVDESYERSLISLMGRIAGVAAAQARERPLRAAAGQEQTR